MGARGLRVLMMTSVIVVLVVWYQLDSKIIVYRETPRNYLLYIEDDLQETKNIQFDEESTTPEIECEPQISAVNRTSNEARVLVYNRVPKCASTLMKHLLQSLSKMNNFIHHSSGIYGQRKLTKSQERAFVKNQERDILEHPDVPISVDRHIYFINFTQYNAVRPIYINMLRNPVSAFVSTYYYVRSPRRWDRLFRAYLHPSDFQLLLKYQREVYPRNDTEPNSQQLVMPNDEWLHKTIEDCVLGGDRECNFEPGTERESFVAFLCGSQPECSVMKSKSALQQAKLNLETEYSVVGIVEHLNVSLEVMEAYVPLYLTGIQDLFLNIDRSQLDDNHTPHSDPSSEVQASLADQFSHDIELYKFARQRLFLQLAAIHDEHSTTV